MKRNTRRSLAASTLTLLLCGCPSSEETPGVDGGPTTCQSPVSGGGVLNDFCPPADPPPGGVLFTISGEGEALAGYAFPPGAPGDVAFDDGWELTWTRILTTVDRVRLSENPDQSPTDQAQSGKVVAELTGPWAVDLHAGGPLEGKGGAGEEAVALAAVANQNLNGNTPFDATSRYAFGFDTLPATASAKNVNLDAAALTDYADMIQNGYSLLMVGTATWKGDNTCVSSDPTYDFSKLPTTVKVRLGFKTPSRYLNCQNPDNAPASGLGGEDYPRGISVKANTFSTAQATFHLDHPFWEALVEDAPLRFDPLAGRFAGSTTAPTVRMEDLVGVDFTAFKDSLGQPMAFRTCVAGVSKTGQLAYDPGGVPVIPAAQPAAALRDFADYMAFNLATFGHLNSDGLCAVQRNFPAPP